MSLFLNWLSSPWWYHHSQSSQATTNLHIIHWYQYSKLQSISRDKIQIILWSQAKEEPSPSRAYGAFPKDNRGHSSSSNCWLSRMRHLFDVNVGYCTYLGRWEQLQLNSIAAQKVRTHTEISSRFQFRVIQLRIKTSFLTLEIWKLYTSIIISRFRSLKATRIQ